MKKKLKNFFEKLLSFPEIYLSMLGSRSRSEIDFYKKKSENIINTGPPLPFSYLRDIYTFGDRILKA